VLLSAGVLVPFVGAIDLNRDRLNKRVLDCRLSGADEVYSNGTKLKKGELRRFCNTYICTLFQNFRVQPLGATHTIGGYTCPEGRRLI
jgi:hypothetical protein